MGGRRRAPRPGRGRARAVHRRRRGDDGAARGRHRRRAPGRAARGVHAPADPGRPAGRAPADRGRLRRLARPGPGGAADRRARPGTARRAAEEGPHRGHLGAVDAPAALPAHRLRRRHRLTRLVPPPVQHRGRPAGPVDDEGRRPAPRGGPPGLVRPRHRGRPAGRHARGDARAPARRADRDAGRGALGDVRRLGRRARPGARPAGDRRRAGRGARHRPGRTPPAGPGPAPALAAAQARAAAQGRRPRPAQGERRGPLPAAAPAAAARHRLGHPEPLRRELHRHLPGELAAGLGAGVRRPDRGGGPVGHHGRGRGDRPGRRAGRPGGRARRAHRPGRAVPARGPVHGAARGDAGARRPGGPGHRCGPTGHRAPGVGPSPALRRRPGDGQHRAGGGRAGPGRADLRRPAARLYRPRHRGRGRDAAFPRRGARRDRPAGEHR